MTQTHRLCLKMIHLIHYILYVMRYCDIDAGRTAYIYVPIENKGIQMINPFDKLSSCISLEASSTKALNAFRVIF